MTLGGKVSRHNCPAAPFAVSNVLAGVAAPSAAAAGAGKKKSGVVKTLGIITVLSDAARDWTSIRTHHNFTEYNPPP